MAGHPHRRYPLEPLRQLTGWSVVRINEIAPCNGSEYRRRRTEGVTALIADRLAVAAGLDPYVIWPEMVEHQIEADSVQCAGCEETFVPLRKSHRWCSTKCYQRAYKREKYRQRYATDPAFREREQERSRQQRLASPKVRRIKAAAYYRANAEVLKAKERARKAARRQRVEEGRRAAA